MIVYKATNKINGKIYIGITTKSLDFRMKYHKRDCQRKSSHSYNLYFYRALRKYGFDNFNWEILDESANSIKELEDLERKYIKKFNTFNNRDIGYNSTKGGSNLFGATDELRKLRSEMAKGKNNPMYGVPSPLKGKKLSQEHKRKISEVLKNSKHLNIKSGSDNLSSKKVLNLDTGISYDTITEAANSVNRHRSSLAKACRNGTKCGNYHWKFL